MISYELILSSTILIVIFCAGSFRYSSIIEAQGAVWYGVPLAPVLLLFMISAVCELARAPADLQEAESELVAGFFTEAGASVFVSSFLGEYVNIVAMSTIMASLFFGGYSAPNFFGSFGGLSFAAVIIGLKTCIGCFLVVWVRAVLPRFTFIGLLTACWTYLLPLTIALLLFFPAMLVAFDATV